MIFDKYLDLKSVPKLMHYLKENEIKTRTDKNFSKGQLYHLLANKVYIDKITHKDKVYDGKHEAIISEGIFKEIQKLVKFQNILYNRKYTTKEKTAERAYKNYFLYFRRFSMNKELLLAILDYINNNRGQLPDAETPGFEEYDDDEIVKSINYLSKDLRVLTLKPTSVYESYDNSGNWKKSDMSILTGYVSPSGLEKFKSEL